MGNMLSLFQTKKEIFIMFQKLNFEKNKQFIYGKHAKNT